MAEEQVVETWQGEDSPQEMGEQTNADSVQEAGEESADLVPLPAVLSALLFSSPKPLSLEALSRLSKRDEETVEAALTEVEAAFDPTIHGIRLERVGGGFQLRTVQEVAPIVRRLVPPKVRRLSRAAAETLAIIAYKQPVQRAEIEAIRGVDALPTLKTLLEHKLVRVVGHDDVVGQPALYATTQTFLERFGLEDLSQLPTIRELGQISDELGEIEEDEEKRGIEPQESRAESA